MKSTFQKFSVIVSACLLLLAWPMSSVAQQDEIQARHIKRIKALSEALRWHDEAGKQQYRASRDRRTQDLYQELDSYITDTFQTTSATADQVRASLDAALGRKEGDDMHNVAFLTDLHANRFLIVGIEIWRGGDAISENAISFRAYRAAGDKFVYVASTQNLIDSALVGFDAALVGLNAMAIPTPPAPSEFWFMAWADVPPLTPYKIVMRLYAFDGRGFRTVWRPKDIVSPRISDAAQVDLNGEVTINRLPEWDSSTILHERYTVKADGLSKIAESTTERE